MGRFVLVLFFILSITPNTAHADSIARGITYEKVRMEFVNGESDVHILKIDPKQTRIHVVQARSGPPRKSLTVRILDLLFFFARSSPKKADSFGMAAVSELAKEVNGTVAVNGGYFSANGMPMGLLVIDNEIVSYPLHDRTALWVGQNEAQVGNFIARGYCSIRGEKYPITSVNQPRMPDQLILFTPRYGDRTQTYGKGLEIVVRRGIVTEQRYANSLIPNDGFVISTRGELGKKIAPIATPGTPIDIVMQLFPIQPGTQGVLRHAIGGGPQLLRSGQLYVTKHEEHFKKDIAEGHAARTAAAVTEHGDLLFVVVDGKRRKGSGKVSNGGASLEELAQLLKDLGGWDALNLDGGGSSTLVIQNKAINQPVDGEERRVSNAIVVEPILTLSEE